MCVCLFVSFRSRLAAAAILSFYLWKREKKNIISAWAIVKASATSGGQLAVIIISRDARVKREFPFFFLFLQKKINEQEADVFSTPGEISDKKQFRELLYSISFRQEERRKAKRNKSLGIRFTFVPPTLRLLLYRSAQQHPIIIC